MAAIHPLHNAFVLCKEPVILPIVLRLWLEYLQVHWAVLFRAWPRTLHAGFKQMKTQRYMFYGWTSAITGAS